MAAELKETVLVVDDLPDNVNLLVRILTQQGYTVPTARDGAQAIDYAQSSLPDLILLDINLPGLDGYETCRCLKQDERTCDIPIIFISAMDSIAEKVKAFQSGGVDYILKPFDFEEVQARVRTHLDILRLRNQLQAANLELAARLEELTRSQKILREREIELDAFINALPNLAFIYDEQGCYLEIMANEASLLLADPEQLKGHLVSEKMPPQAATQILDAIHKAIESGHTQVIEYQIPVLAGGERWFEGRVALMEKNPDGHSKVVFIAVEITKRHLLYEEVQRLAYEDPLTACFNRRHFMQQAERELQRAARYQRPLSLLMLDIDGFKGFNDRYGHQAGDRILCALVDLCQKQLRSNDILGRYGGEEFIILLPETDGACGLKVAGRLRKQIEEMEIASGEDRLSITVSMGVASLKPGEKTGETLDMLIQRADRGLYAAKSAGRNTIRTG
jgi:two-component system cell cycle response regulator